MADVEAIRNILATQLKWRDADGRVYANIVLPRDRAEELVALLSTQGAGARTPGTVEVCENHVYKECRNHGGGMRFDPCKVKPCPLAPSPAPAPPPQELPVGVCKLGPTRASPPFDYSDLVDSSEPVSPSPQAAAVTEEELVDWIMDGNDGDLAWTLAEAKRSAKALLSQFDIRRKPQGGG